MCRDRSSFVLTKSKTATTSTRQKTSLKPYFTGCASKCIWTWRCWHVMYKGRTACHACGVESNNHGKPVGNGLFSVSGYPGCVSTSMPEPEHVQRPILMSLRSACATQRQATALSTCTSHQVVVSLCTQASCVSVQDAKQLAASLQNSPQGSKGAKQQQL